MVVKRYNNNKYNNRTKKQIGGWPNWLSFGKKKESGIIRGQRMNLNKETKYAERALGKPTSKPSLLSRLLGKTKKISKQQPEPEPQYEVLQTPKNTTQKRSFFGNLKTRLTSLTKKITTSKCKHRNITDNDEIINAYNCEGFNVIVILHYKMMQKDKNPSQIFTQLNDLPGVKVVVIADDNDTHFDKLNLCDNIKDSKQVKHDQNKLFNIDNNAHIILLTLGTIKYALKKPEHNTIMHTQIPEPIINMLNDKNSDAYKLIENAVKILPEGMQNLCNKQNTSNTPNTPKTQTYRIEKSTDNAANNDLPNLYLLDFVDIVSIPMNETVQHNANLIQHNANLFYNSNYIKNTNTNNELSLCIKNILPNFIKVKQNIKPENPSLYVINGKVTQDGAKFKLDNVNENTPILKHFKFD